MKALSVFCSRYLLVFLNVTTVRFVRYEQTCLFCGGGAGVSQKLHWKQDVRKIVLILKKLNVVAVYGSNVLTQ